ncbi:MAG: FAD-binding oxidoreductase [Syntrophaceae bacterium]|nr:FAD-binding oxidoreductase [Syntrophaceae bacterium]
MILKKLAEIVGKQYVSDSQEEKFIYSRDQGVQEPHEPDYVVLPNSAEEVQKILLLANEEKISVVPMGGGLVLSGLTIPQKGGMVLDMKRMNRILEVNEKSHYAVVEAGTSQGMLDAYLKKHHPTLKHSLPDAPPVATIAGNIAIHGSGHLSQSEGGFHSEMVTGLEVVLPTGEIVKLGSCSTVPYWFSRAPLPDLVGLFLGWNGTTGVITKVGLKLYPRPKLHDVLLFMTEDVDTIPDILYKIIHTGVAEDINIGITPKPDYLEGLQITIISIVANSHEEMKLKTKMIREALREYFESKDAGFLPAPPDMKASFLETPQKSLTKFADVQKGGGFEYVGAIMPIERIPDACKAGLEITRRHDIPYGLGARIVGRGHSAMFFYAYPFNRADGKEMENVEKALLDTNEAALKIGGIPWKTEIPGQQLILKHMDHSTYEMMTRIRKLLDPNGIMNPGNWEAE